jgi:hypothetical protein
MVYNFGITRKIIPMTKYTEKTCKKHGICRFVLEGSGYYRCTKCRSTAVHNRRKKVKLLLVQYKGGKCEQCGYNKCVAALEFHHLDPTQKDFGIGANGHTLALAKLKQEVDKCILVCSNCHREIHDAG